MPILTDIETQMATLITGIKIANGYNFTWGSVNEIDKSKWVYPAASIYVESEECEDDPEGAWSRTYLQKANIIIEVQTRLVNEETQPTFEIDKDMNKALDDLKKLFGTSYSVSGYCDIVMYQGMTREVFQTGDLFIPKKMITRWMVKYTQSRTSPSASAE